MDRNNRHDFLLGLVFFGALALLLYYTIVLTGFSLGEKQSLTAWFPSAQGLKEGDSVLIAGVQSGTVKAVALDQNRPDDRRISVRMEFNEPLDLRQGYAIRIAEFSALGGRVVQVEPGPSSAAPLAAGAEIVGTVAPSALGGLTDLVERVGPDLEAVLGNFRQATDDLLAGSGLLGGLLYDDAMKADAADFLDSAAAVARDLREGRGVLGTLVNDEETRERMLSIVGDAESAIEDVRVILRGVRDGEGLAGALFNDPDVRDEFEAFLGNLDAAALRLRTMLDDAAEGRAGLLGRLVGDNALADDAVAFMDNLAEITRRLVEGEGTIGHLLAENEAYDELMTALKVLNGQLEDAREAQPVASFVSILFGPF